MTQRFTHPAGELAEPPVRLVEPIGDEAMLASEDPDPSSPRRSRRCRPPTATTCCRLRAGAAAETAIGDAGDRYGPPVNLAARITAGGRRGFKASEGEVDLYRVARG